MPTRLSKFIMGRHLSKVLLVLYVLLMCFAAYETNAALCLLVNQPHLYGSVYIAFGVIALPVIVKELLRSKWSNRVFRKISSFLGCFFLYYFLLLVGWEIVCVFIRPAETVKAVGVVSVVAVAAATVLCGYLRNKGVHVKPYQIAFGNGSREYRIALVSDIHLGVFVGEKHIQRTVRKINELDPDLVVISGDIFDTDNSMLKRPQDLNRISKQFCKIKSKEGVYAVVGNHDPAVSDKVFRRFLKASKIRLLDNEARVLSLLNLVGRTDVANNERTELVDVLSKTDPSKPVVVLDHKPENIRDAAEYGVDLVLCGHTHRGQLFPITLLTKWATGKDYFYGHSVTGKIHGIIISGVGFFELPVRIGTSNEIVDIRLRV